MWSFRLTLIIISVLVECSHAQNDRSNLSRLTGDEKSSLRSILAQPDSTRKDLFAASVYPAGISGVTELQKRSAFDFQNLAGRYSRKRQRQLWDISRFPELAPWLLNHKSGRKKEIRAYLTGYPEDTRKGALYFVRKEPSALVEMTRIRMNFESSYDSLINTFPVYVKPVYNKLPDHPELLSLLTQDLSTTILLGEIYERDTVLVQNFADSVYNQISAEQQAQFNDWKEGIEKDPAVSSEFKKVASEYDRNEFTYDDVYGQPGSRITVITRIAPYPLWAGYPHWYITPIWRPYPWWYHSGFYWDPLGSLVFLGMPTYNFGWWYYGFPRYYNRYHRTHMYFINHYNHYPRSRTGFNRSIRDRYVQPVNKPRSSGAQGPTRR